jgi:hypothetical protein
MHDSPVVSSVPKRLVDQAAHSVQIIWPDFS